MIVRSRIGYAKADRDFIKKWRCCNCFALCPVIIACAKDQLIDARKQFISDEQRRIGAAIRIGGRGFQYLTPITVERVETKFYSSCRLAVGSIQNVRGQSAHLFYLFILNPKQPNGGRASVNTPRLSPASAIESQVRLWASRCTSEISGSSASILPPI